MSTLIVLISIWFIFVAFGVAVFWAVVMVLEEFEILPEPLDPGTDAKCLACEHVGQTKGGEFSIKGRLEKVSFVGLLPFSAIYVWWLRRPRCENCGSAKLVKDPG